MMIRELQEADRLLQDLSIQEPPIDIQSTQTFLVVRIAIASACVLQGLSRLAIRTLMLFVVVLQTLT